MKKKHGKAAPQKSTKTVAKPPRQAAKKIASKFPAEIEKKIEEAKSLRIQEQALLEESRKADRSAMLLAFSVGRIIHETPRKYQKGVVKTLAREWRCSTQTVYNYDHLFCGVLYESNINRFPEITRKYFQALGSSIRWYDDFFGYAVHLQLLLTPAYQPSDDPGERKVDHQRVLEIGKLVKHTRQVATEDLKAGGLLNSWRRVDGEGGGIGFLFPAEETNSEKGVGLRRLCGLLLHEVGLLVGNKVGTVKFKDFEDIKDEILGLGDPNIKFAKLTAKLLIIHRERHRRVKKANTGTQPTLAKTVADRVFHGRCQDVLSDRTLFPERSVDAVVTDPPYSDEYYESWKKWTRVDHDAEKTVAKEADLVGKVARLLVERKIIREQFVWFNFCPLDVVHIFLPPILRAFSGVPHIHQVLAWDKMELPKMGGHQLFGRQVEAVIYVNVGERPLAMTKRDDGKQRLLHSSLLQFHVEKKNEDNIFWKPLSVLKHLITLATGEGQSLEKCNQVILDPFAGSGSTGVAAIECGREYRLIESHEKQYGDCRASVLLAMKAVGLPKV